MKNKFDIQIKGNMIGGRQGWAYICNSLKYPVLKADMDAPQEYEDYKTFSNVRLIYKIGDRDLPKVTELTVENGKWSLTSGGSMLKDSFSFSEMTDFLKVTDMQQVRENDIVVVAMFSNNVNFAWLQLFKVGKLDKHCIKMAELIPLTEEEMMEIEQDAYAWCER